MSQRVVIYGIMTDGTNYSEVEISGEVEGNISYNDIIQRFERKGYRFTRSREQQENGGDRIIIGKDRPSSKSRISVSDFLDRIDNKINDKEYRGMKEENRSHKSRDIVKGSDYKEDYDEVE